MADRIVTWNPAEGRLKVSNTDLTTVGGGSPTDIVFERLRNWFDLSVYEFLTPEVFQTDVSLVDGASTMTFNSSNSTYQATTGSQTLKSLNLLDDEFAALGENIGRVDFSFQYLSSAIDSAPVVALSRDGGTTYQTVSTSNYARIGSASDQYQGSHPFTDTETLQTVSEYALANADNSVILDNSAIQQAAQVFTVSSTTKIVKQITLGFARFGTPTGAVRCKIVKANGSNPSTNAADIVATSNWSNGLTTYTWSGGLQNITFTIGAVLPAANYFIVIETDATYIAQYGIDYISVRSDNSSPPNPVHRVYNGTAWSAGTQNIVYLMEGHPLDLRIRITSSAASQILGFGVLYRIKSGIVTGLQSRQVFSFDGIVNNTSSFTLSFLPDPDKIKAYWVQQGKAYVVGAFSLSGKTVVFEPNSFNQTGTQTLVFEQSEGSGFDNSDINAALLAANHLGSPDASIDKSSAGLGIYLRRPDGTLRQLRLDNSDNIVVESV